MCYLVSHTPIFPHKVEAPAGVGFSYSDNPGVDYNTDDNKTANDNYKFLVNWFSNYSEYINNDFYVTYVHSNTNSSKYQSFVMSTECRQFNLHSSSSLACTCISKPTSSY